MSDRVRSLVEQFERDGVVRAPGLLGAEDLATINQEIARLSALVNRNDPGPDVVLEPDGQSVRNLWRLEAYSEFFRGLALRRSVLDLVEPMVHGAAVLVAVETFNKPARVGSGVPPHQDNAYFCQAPPDMLTVWIALDPCTEENGPVSYLKGSHREGMRPHKPSGVKGNSMGLAEPVRGEKEIFVGLLERGDALLHHCQTIHYSAPNRSEQARCGLLLVYRGGHTQRDENLAQAYALARA